MREAGLGCERPERAAGACWCECSKRVCERLASAGAPGEAERSCREGLMCVCETASILVCPACEIV